MYQTDIQVGIELEFPYTPPGNDPMTSHAVKSSHGDMARDAAPSGRFGRDPTVGIEHRSPILNISQAAGWFAEAVSVIEAETGERYCPCSILPQSTAGLHIHFSDVSDSEAREVYEASTHPEVQILACSGVHEGRNGTPEYPVVRQSDFVHMEFDRSPRGSNAAVNKVEPGHFEWRLPEPVVPADVEHTLRVLDLAISEGHSAAINYAAETLREEPMSVTSVKRAEKCDIGDEDQLTYAPGITVQNVNRSPNNHTTTWFEDVRNNHERPYIYRVSLRVGGEEREYYGFYSNSYDDEEWTDETPAGTIVTYNTMSVLDAVSLQRVTDPEVVAAVNDAISDARSGGFGTKSGAATKTGEELKKYVK